MFGKNLVPVLKNSLRP